MASIDIFRKSDVGGVVFPIYSREELIEAYSDILKKVTQSLAPLNMTQATKMIRSLKCYPLLTGSRNGISYDITDLAKVLIKISRFAMTMNDAIEEMEINPLIVLPEDQGVMALDGLITLNHVLEEVSK